MAYLPQHNPAFNYLRHLMLLYGNAATPWTPDDLKYYVARMDEHGRPVEWLFDSFLFLNVKSASGHDLCADINKGTTMAGEGDFFAACSPQPGNVHDWRELLEFYLGPNGAVATLDRTIGECATGIGAPYPHRHNVVLMLPYPHITQSDFGSISGGAASLDFTTTRQNLDHATRQRLEASRWMVDECVRRWKQETWRNVNLLGVYWMFETVYRSWDIDDHWLLKELRPHIHSHGLKFLWIPFWSTYNVHLLDDYQRYYFDLAFLQPTYMFYLNGKSIAAAAEAARQRNAGIEMEYYLELNEPIAIEGERHARFRDYLNGGVTHGYMTEAALAHFHGVGSLARMHQHADPVEREFYADICDFVNGRYRLKPALTPSVSPIVTSPNHA